MKPILVHCHIFYPELWSELKEYLKNISVPYDLYVTTIEANKNLKNDVLNFNAKAHFEIVENRGYDIGPFIHVINQINLNDYSYVIKVHTKRDMPKGSTVNRWICNGTKWRNWSLSFLMRENFEKCLNVFENDKKLGMTGNFHLIIENENGCDTKAEKWAKDLLNKANLKFEKYCFIAGTMFMCRASVLKPLQQLKLKITDFEIPDKRHTTGFPHAIERFIGLSICSQNYKIKDIFTSIKYRKICKIWQPIEYFCSILFYFFFQKKITSKGNLVIKICKIPVCSIKKQTIEFYKYLYEKERLHLLYLKHKISKEDYKIKKQLLKEKMLLCRCSLGVAYNVFDGEELLEDSIKSIRPIASFIVVVWQKISNYGEKANPKLEKLLQRLKEQGLIDKLYLYEPKLDQIDAHYNERIKRDIGLRLVKKSGCNYFLSMDTDEFYYADQVQNALKYISENKISSSAVSIIEYLKEPTYQIVNGYTFSPAEYKNDYTFYVPFIMKIHRFRKQNHSGKGFPCLVDPTRGLNTNEKFYLFPKHIVAMHHFSTTRKNLAKKYRNSNLRNKNNNKELENLQNKILSYDFNANLVQLSNFNGLYIQKVPNVFNINISEENNK